MPRRKFLSTCSAASAHCRWVESLQQGWPPPREGTARSLLRKRSVNADMEQGKAPTTLLYNGISFAPVIAKCSMVLHHSAANVWSIVGQFGRQALWMGSVEGQQIYTQLLGGISEAYVGAVRVFGIGSKMLFEQVTRLDNQEMILGWQLITHPGNSNPFPASFVNFSASISLYPVRIPGGSTFMEWRMELLTELSAVQTMHDSMRGIMELGFANLEKYLASGKLSTAATQRVPAPPSSYGISDMPQPITVPGAAMPLPQQLGPTVPTSYFAAPNPTYMPPPKPGSSQHLQQLQQAEHSSSSTTSPPNSGGL